MDRAYTKAVTSLQPSDFQPLVDLAWLEDLPAGDITSESLFSTDEQAKARLFSKSNGVICGLGVVPVLLTKTNGKLKWAGEKNDGDKIEYGTTIGFLHGELLSILKIERILLNFLQYLSGIATNANLVSSKFPQLMVLDTRKTLPGYRKLAKYAVYQGGGCNHRLNLSDMAMIKDNHVAKAGSIQSAVEKIRENHPTKKIELEIDSLEQLPSAIESKPDILLLDNFSDDDTKKAIETIQKSNKRIQIECSGGITPDKLDYLSQWKGIGVSMGYLTHTVQFLDLSLEIL